MIIFGCWECYDSDRLKKETDEVLTKWCEKSGAGPIRGELFWPVLDDGPNSEVHTPMAVTGNELRFFTVDATECVKVDVETGESGVGQE